MPTYYMENYGCALAEFDSATMAALLESEGYQRVTSPDEADLVVVNTCAVRLDTEAKIVKRLNELKPLVKGKLIVAGCL